MLPRRVRSLLVQLASLALGLGLLYLALRAVDFARLGETLREANYWYLIPMGLVALLSHAIRAWRWLLLLETLPGSTVDRRTDLRPAFYSVMIGYMVNYAAPRLGEFARAGNYAAQSQTSFSGAFGTVVSERVLDVLTLLVGLVIAAVVVSGHMPRLGVVVDDVVGQVHFGPVFVAVAIGVVVLILVLGIWLVRRIRRSSEKPGERGRMASMIHSFGEGLLSLVRVPRRTALLVSTAAIWTCYLITAYLPFLLLGITDLTLGDAWLLLVIGSIGLMVPTPGGIGSYHFVTIETMTRVLGVGLAPATAYAVLLHALQLVLYAATGFICLLLQGRGMAIRPLVDDHAGT